MKNKKKKALDDDEVDFEEWVHICRIEETGENKQLFTLYDAADGKGTNGETGTKWWVGGVVADSSFFFFLCGNYCGWGFVFMCGQVWRKERSTCENFCWG